MMRLFLLNIALCFFCVSFLHAQSNGSGVVSQTPDTAQSADENAIPSSFRGVSLGMSLDDLKTALSQDALFGYRGDPDVSFIAPREETYIETAGTSFIRRGLFQIKSDKLYVISLTLNTTFVSYYDVFSSLVKKYGEPSSLDPSKAVWESDATRLSIERPFTVRYIDKQTFTQVLNESSAKKTEPIRAREDFLSDF